MRQRGRFAREIKKLRIAKGHPQREWGPLLGVSWITAQNWELGLHHPWRGQDTAAGRKMRRAVEDAILTQARKVPPKKAGAKGKARRRKEA